MLSPEKPNVIRVITALLKSQINKESAYYKDGVLQGFIIKYTDVMTERLRGDIENLGKENIDAANSKAVSIQKTLYRLNRNEYTYND